MKDIGFYDLSTETWSRFGLALTIEANEFVNETPWKQWKKKPASPERMKEEFADFLAFIGCMITLMDLYGITVDDLALSYVLKLRENRIRFGPDHPRRGEDT